MRAGRGASARSAANFREERRAAATGGGLRKRKLMLSSLRQALFCVETALAIIICSSVFKIYKYINISEKQGFPKK